MQTFQYFPTRKGRATPTPGKFFKGVTSIIALITVILAPMFLFAFLNSFGTRAPPKCLKLSVAVGGYPVSSRFCVIFYFLLFRNYKSGINRLYTKCTRLALICIVSLRLS